MKFNLDKQKVKITFESYNKSNREYPTTNDIEKLRATHPHLPTAKWIQRHGGIIPFYNSLGLHYIDARTGIRRANIATAAIKKSQGLDLEFSKALVKTFGENNVHWQSPYNKGITLHRSDFRIYKPDGTFFFIDLFFPKDMDSFQGCLGIKINKLKATAVENDAQIYFVSCNPESTPTFAIEQYISSRKTPLPLNIKIMHINEAFDFIKMV